MDGAFFVCFARRLILFLLLLLFSASSYAQEVDSSEWTPRDEDLRILAMRVEQYRLDDVLLAYQRKNILIVPIGLLAEILDLAVDVDLGAATVGQSYRSKIEQKDDFCTSVDIEIDLETAKSKLERQQVFGYF